MPRRQLEKVFLGLFARAPPHLCGFIHLPTRLNGTTMFLLPVVFSGLGEVEKALFDLY